MLELAHAATKWKGLETKLAFGVWLYLLLKIIFGNSFVFKRLIQGAEAQDAEDPGCQDAEDPSYGRYAIFRWSISNVVKAIFRLCIAGAFTKFAIFENRILFEMSCNLNEKKDYEFPFLFTVFIYTIEWQSALCAAGRQTSSHEANIHWGGLWAAGGKQALRRLLEQKLCVGSVGCWRNQKCLYNNVWQCIADAFTIFAIFENRIFWNELQLSAKKDYEFPFFLRFYI